MRARRILLATALLICSLSLLVGCSVKPKSFTAEEMTVTLTSRFREVKQTGCTAMFSSRKEVVFVFRESISSLADKGITEASTLKEYAAVIIANNSLSDVTVEESDSLTYFTYEKEGDGKPFRYLAVVYKSTNAFWLVQFAAEADAFQQQNFIAYAQSVAFEE